MFSLRCCHCAKLGAGQGRDGTLGGEDRAFGVEGKLLLTRECDAGQRLRFIREGRPGTEYRESQAWSAGP